MDRKFLGHGTPTETMDQAFWLGRALEAREEQRTGNAVVPELRDSIRRPFGIEALINYGLTYSTSWRVRNLSTTGAFVEMEAAQLPDGMHVELVLRYRYQGKSIEHRLPAVVTRIAHDGLALTFGRYDDQTYTDLVNLLSVL